MNNATNEATLLEICSTLVKTGALCSSDKIYAIICRVASGSFLNPDEAYGLNEWAHTQNGGIWARIACAAHLIDSDRDEGKDGNPVYTANVLKLIMNELSMKTKRIAFWKYDRYPYTLFGEIIGDECQKSYPGPNHYEIKGYGPGHWFEPFMILPEDEAAPITERLAELEESYDREMQRVHKDAMILLENCLPDHPKFKK